MSTVHDVVEPGKSCDAKFPVIGRARRVVIMQALKIFGTDFTLISRVFAGRSRRQIKNKYTKENKVRIPCMPVCSCLVPPVAPVRRRYTAAHASDLLAYQLQDVRFILAVHDRRRNHVPSARCWGGR